MKKSAFLLLLFVSATCCAQSDSVNASLSFSKVITVDSTFSKESLYRKAKRWYGVYFKSGKDVLQVDDKESCEVSGKGFSDAYWTSLGVTQNAGKLWFEVSIYAKDGRYKFIVSNFRHEGYSYGKVPFPDFGLLTNNPTPPDVSLFMIGQKGKATIWNDFKEQAAAIAQRVEASLVAYMAKPDVVDSDW